VSDKNWEKFVEKKSLVFSLISFAHEQSIKISEIEGYIKTHNFEPLKQGSKLYSLIARNEFSLLDMAREVPRLKRFVEEQGITTEVLEQAEIQIKYKGYIEREKLLAEKLHRLENIIIPDGFDFMAMNALTIEARQKLTKIRPQTIGQASRIPGVSPADINVLLIKFGR
jgi:tRNA uridine 5-carboxymethylaminomethyl modification enzyme